MREVSEVSWNTRIDYVKLRVLLVSFAFVLVSSILIILPVFLPLGFSPDSFNYYYTINLPVSEYNFLAFEPLYWLIVYVNQVLFSGSWTSFLLFFSSIYVILSIYLIKKYSVNPIISLAIFVILFYPNFGLIQIRNGVSIAFLWWAFFDLVEGKKIKFFLKVTIATLFHYSSIVFFLLPLVNRAYINKKLYFILPFIGLFLGQYVFKIEFYQFVVNYLPEFIKFKAQGYLSLVMLYGTEHRLNQINIFNAQSLFLIMLYYFSLMLNSKDKYFITIKKILAFSIFFFFAFKSIPVFSFRFSNNFFTFIVFLIPYIVQHFRKEQRHLIYYLLVVVLILLSWNIYVRHEVFDFSLL